jgi:polysaccharide chain length determinant protein (PEP-CTERM system associated)
MINTEKSLDIHDYIEVFLRRKWYFVIPFVVIVIAAVVYAFTLPKMYRATTLVLVTPQKVPENFVRPTVTSRIEDRLQSISQEIMSRTRLEMVIAEFKLYADQAKSLSQEEIVELMRKNIQVEIKGKEGGFFTISYIGGDPKLVTMVTNKLASLFIEENLKLREQQAQGTSDFLTVELNAMRTKLEAQEATITEFKKKHISELPEQRDANLKILEQLQLQSQKVNDNVKAAQDRKVIIQKQLSDMKIQMAVGRPSENAPSGSTEPPREEAATTTESDSSQPSLPTRRGLSLEAQLIRERALLSELKSKYTAKHPDILRAERHVADLEKKVEEMKVQGMGQNTKVRETAMLDPSVVASFKAMENQLIATELEMRRLQDEDAKIKARIAGFQARIENTPMRELAMTNLARDYQNTKEAYQSLLTKSQEAQQAENLERRQKGEQFKVIDPARIPEKPLRGKVLKILLFGLLAGLGFGLGMAFLREQMDRSFRDPDDLETTLEHRVLANIPKIEKKAA